MQPRQQRLRPSHVLARLRNGETALCTKLNLADSRVVEIAALSGFDCVWTDMEHVPNDWSVIEKQILAAKAYGIDIIVRVARGSYSDLIRPLEMDATGIMVPHVMSLDDARTIVRQTKFHPVGLRPLDGGNADGAFCLLPLTDYMEQTNRERFNILQIEDPEPMEELEDILSLPGLDMIFFGPGDYSQAIGVPGQINHPRVVEARIRVAELARRKGKLAGTVGSAEQVLELEKMGYRFISVGADVVALGRYFSEVVGTVRGGSEPEPASAERNPYRD